MQVYQSWLGYYNSHLKRLDWTREELVRRAETFAVDGLGMPSAPALDARTVGMMALKGVEGLAIADANASPPQKQGRGRGGDGRSGGRLRGGGNGRGGGGQRGGGGRGGCGLGQ